MTVMRKIHLAAAVALILCSCGSTSNLTTRQEQYPKMYEEKPLTLLVMPPVNNTANVEAKELLYTSISKPLAEAGYYVISPLLAMDVLKSESAYDAEMFVDAPLEKFGKYFGADAVIFSQIDKWTKSGFGVDTSIRYFIRSAKTGEILFDRKCDLHLDLSRNSGSSSLLGILADLAVSAINTAATEHIVAARMANRYIFGDIPRGKYDSMYGSDQGVAASAKDITATVN